MPASPFSLENRIAIVTGGGVGIGRSIAIEFARAGADVVVASRKLENLEPVTAEIVKLGRRSFAMAVDVRQEDAVKELVERTVRDLGRLDIMVNNAGASFRANPEDITANGWNTVVGINLNGVFFGCKWAGRQMMAQGGGVIINVSSMYGMVGPDQRLYEEPDTLPAFKPVTYSVTKSAVYGLTKYLAAYWAGKKIRVNTLTLGGVENDQTPGFLQRYADRTPMRRMARPGEYCGALLFLASDASSYMTGANLVVDGGWTAW